jgi:septum formation protein
MRIILGSGSPRRQQLLHQAELTFTVVTADIAENYPVDMPAYAVPEYIAQNKADAVRLKIDKDDLLITADTIVLLNNRIIGKPIDETDAIAMLAALSGQTHKVITGVNISNGEKCISFSDVTEVVFNEISTLQIKHYVHQYQPYDKAGAYAIQEWIGVVGIKAIEGCFYNVMGLPVSKVLSAMAELQKR